VIKALKLLVLRSSLRRFVSTFLCLLFAGVASANVQIQNVQGRWEIAITSGDTSAQLSAIGQSTISTYLLKNGTVLTNMVPFTWDTIACDVANGNNVTVANSSIDSQGNVTLIFTFTQTDQTSFQYAFAGVLTPGQAGAPTVITGTYQRSAGGCTQGSLGTSTPDGNFIATFFSDLSGTWAGAFDGPDDGSGPTSVPASFTLTTNLDKTLSGTVDAPGLMSSSGAACLAGTVTLQPGMLEGVSNSAGAYFELFGMDSNGTRLLVNGYASNPDNSVAAVGEDNPEDGTNGTANDGTNNSYTAYYGITGGPCEGLGGGDAPFKLIKSKKEPLKKYPVHHLNGPNSERTNKTTAVEE